MFTTRRLRQLLRLFTIQRVLARHGLDEVVWRTHLFRSVAWVRRLLPFWRSRQPLGVRIREALEELGPIFVKFGQALSVRPDLLSPEVAMELAKLQDRVPPFPGEQALATLEAAFGRPVGELFAEFDRTPLAAASIAQVHAARLADGKAVVVKVLRPNVAGLIQRDIEVLYAIASLAEAYWPEARRLHPTEVVAEFEKTLAAELDLMREAANAAQLKRNFAGSELLYVPDIYWDWCRPNVLTMERIFGLRVDDMAALNAAGTDIRRLAENGVEIFFTQVFRHNFFHADMHPGNIFVDVTTPAFPKYVAVDFGIVGTLDARDQHYLAENFLAFFRRDYRRVATLHVDSSWVPAGTRVDELESAIRAVCEPIFNKPLKDISFGLVLLRLFQTARQFHMEVQPQLVLLQKVSGASSIRSSTSGKPRSRCSRNGCASGATRARS
jgi:ubiquinone biosynthesis protein